MKRRILLSLAFGAIALLLAVVVPISSYSVFIPADFKGDSWVDSRSYSDQVIDSSSNEYIVRNGRLYLRVQRIGNALLLVTQVDQRPWTVQRLQSIAPRAS
jgi:hypothetical protein